MTCNPSFQTQYAIVGSKQICIDEFQESEIPRCIPCQHELIAVYPKDRKYCEKCKKEGRNNKYGKHLNEYTIEEICVRNGSNRYDNIRNHANRLYKNRTHQCEKCSYDKHTEICHIKPISSFSKDTKVGVVNGKQNIMFLCPNCHWEHDRQLKK